MKPNTDKEKATVRQKAPAENPNMKTDTQTQSKVLPAITRALHREDELIAHCNQIVTERNRAKAQAAKLAGALRNLLSESADEYIAMQALAEYESEVQR